MRCNFVPSSVDLLASNQTLEHLKMRACSLHDDAIRSLARVLEYTKLKTLNLEDNDFTTIVGTELLRVVKDHPTLTVEMPR